MHYHKGIHENYHNFALFDSPQIGNLMTPELSKQNFPPFGIPNTQGNTVWRGGLPGSGTAIRLF